MNSDLHRDALLRQDFSRPDARNHRDRRRHRDAPVPRECNRLPQTTTSSKLRPEIESAPVRRLRKMALSEDALWIRICRRSLAFCRLVASAPNFLRDSVKEDFSRRRQKQKSGILRMRSLTLIRRCALLERILVLSHRLMMFPIFIRLAALTPCILILKLV